MTGTVQISGTTIARICDEAIERVYTPDIDKALVELCLAATMCGRSICGGGTRPRLTFRTPEQRLEFLTAAEKLDANSFLAAWLAQTNPRLAIHARGKGISSIPSIDFSKPLTLN